jgi:hypothetical protein
MGTVLAAWEFLAGLRWDTILGILGLVATLVAIAYGVHSERKITLAFDRTKEAIARSDEAVGVAQAAIQRAYGTMIWHQGCGSREEQVGGTLFNGPNCPDPSPDNRQGPQRVPFGSRRQPVEGMRTNCKVTGMKAYHSPRRLKTMLPRAATVEFGA